MFLVKSASPLWLVSGTLPINSGFAYAEAIGMSPYLMSLLRGSLCSWRPCGDCKSFIIKKIKLNKQNLRKLLMNDYFGHIILTLL